MTALQSALQTCVATVSERLADQTTVERMTLHPDPWIGIGDTRRSRWMPVSLASGPLSMALLFAELSHQDAGHRRLAHNYLIAATEHAGAAPVGGLQGGLCAVAFTARSAARSSADYATLLSKLDAKITGHVATIIRAERILVPSEGGCSFAATDVISGLAGIGRYLLTRPGPADESLHEILRFLVERADPLRLNGTERPGWWIRHSPSPEIPDLDGHVNYGLAHGMPGTLAFLSLAWHAGCRVSGQDDAIHRMATWLITERGRYSAVPLWPASLSYAEYFDGAPAQRPVTAPSWCYGAPGTARAIQLAGLALAEPGWGIEARSAVHEVVGWLDAGGDLGETMLCHGWAGVLQTLCRMNGDFKDPVIERAIDQIAARLLAEYDEVLPFGFQARQMADSHHLDLPGFLEGAAGIALAITTYTSGSVFSGWDSALMLA
ncbi:lanthionine synthetase C family protein [Streptomyces sp. SID13031]|uniref:lanthionine synthetase C family protein n=1 Tax=Streptomyces sp. SID13031 TaxID=2706046 RepID=UPI0013C67779|nr:lanthionine synthetase C family protein [Streptomyces sp. SID13031]NEA34319.1 lanthionine synthetase C family protein [Streptomyces sp. SID13031]